MPKKSKSFLMVLKGGTEVGRSVKGYLLLVLTVALSRDVSVEAAEVDGQGAVPGEADRHQEYGEK